MKLNKQHLFAFAFLLPLLGFSQEKMLTVADAVLKQRTTLAPTRLNGLAWVNETTKFTYLAKKNNEDCVVMQDGVLLTKDTVLTLEQYSSIISKAIGGSKKQERIGNITWLSETSFRFVAENNFYQADIKTGDVNVICYLPKAAEHVSFESTTGKAAFVLNNNIYFSDKNTQPQHIKGDDGMQLPNAITTDGSEDLVYGQSVHQNEFGITKGLFWSPKGNRLAYYQMNESMVTDFLIYDLKNKPASVKKNKYPMTGAISHHVKIWVKDFVKNRTVMLQTGEPAEQYLTNVAWHPGEEKIYVAVVNRGQKEMKLNEYDGVTGAFVKTLFTETSTKYVEPEEPVVFCPKNPQQFIWQSKRNGYNHLYLYYANGRLDKQLTTGNFDVTEFLGFSENGTTAFYNAASEDGLDRYCYKVDLKTGKNTKLTLLPGTHQVLFNTKGELMLDMFSSTAIPRRVTLITATGEERALLVNAINPLAEYKTCEMKLLKLKAADSTTNLNARIFLPPAFDETKTYPVLVYLYGGPHAQMVTNSWLGGADMWLYYMAQQGFIVFTMDNRGSANRGQKFEQATHRNLGVAEKADQTKGIEYLRSLKYVDTKRIGIYGWSFGGFVATTMMSKTDFFKAGVAGGPVIDWSLYEIMYTERYMEKPVENKAGYDESNLLNHTKNLKGRLMLIHGTDDNVVLWQHSLSYIKKCVDEGIEVDYFVYPEHLHNVLGKDRVHLMNKITQFFKQNL